MKQLSRWVLVAVLPLLFALVVPAAAGKTTPTRTRALTLVTEKGPIRAFAQDVEAIAWIDPGYKVHVRSLLLRTGAVVGSAKPAAGAPMPVLTLAGTRALWTQFNGGNSMEHALWAGGLGARSVMVDLFMGGSEAYGGIFLAGAAGDGPTLLYGKTAERCDDPSGLNCSRLDGSGGVSFVTGQLEQPPISGIPTPAMLAFAAHDPRSGRISQGRLAVVPAESPVVTDLGNVPRVAANGPVRVYWFLNKLVLASTVSPRGTVKAIALDFDQLAALVQRSDGTKALVRYAVKGGTLLGTTAVPKSTTSELSMSKAGIVYRVERSIYLLRSGKATLVWKASGTPIGLSIEGKRIAWAENVKGHGRIVALTLR